MLKGGGIHAADLLSSAGTNGFRARSFLRFYQQSLKAGKRIERTLLKPIRFIRRRFLRLPLEYLPNAPDWFRVYRYLHKHPETERAPGGWLYKGKLYPDYLTVGGASCAISRTGLRFCKGEGVDVGAGVWPLPGSIPADLSRGPGAGVSIADFEDGSLDYIFSSHCLEHIESWQQALHEWVRKLKPGGIIFLYLPHPDCAIWHPGSPFVGKGHKWIPTPLVVKGALRELGCKITHCDDGPDGMWSFYLCGRKRPKVDKHKARRGRLAQHVREIGRLKTTA